MKQDIANKIKKLMKLAEGSTFPEESASALAKAHSLMVEHKISESMLDTSDDEPEEDIIEPSTPVNEEDAGKRKSASWKKSLAHRLAHANGCFVFYFGPEVKIVGKPSNIDAVRYLYQYCRKEIDRLTKANCKGEGRTYANNFRLGCVAAIRDAIKAETESLRKKYQSNSKALIVIDGAKKDLAKADQWAHKKHKFRRSSGGRVRGNQSAFSAGKQAGAGIYSGNRTRVGGAQKKIGG